MAKTATPWEKAGVSRSKYYRDLAKKGVAAAPKKGKLAGAKVTTLKVTTVKKIEKAPVPSAVAKMVVQDYMAGNLGLGHNPFVQAAIREVLAYHGY